jgi:hypothetical protein
LVNLLKTMPCRFLLSTWYQNKYRTNSRIQSDWNSGHFTINQVEHFYHVGPTEGHRNPMIEALIANFPGKVESSKTDCLTQRSLFDTVDESPNFDS